MAQRSMAPLYPANALRLNLTVDKIGDYDVVFGSRQSGAFT